MIRGFGRLRVSQGQLKLVSSFHSNASLASKIGDVGGRLSEAVDALDHLVQRGTCIDNSVFYDVLKRCIGHKELVLGSRLYSLAVRSGYESNAFLANHFICMYASHGRLEEASRVFTRVAAPNRYMWASIILAHVRQGQPTEAIELYQRMRHSGVRPDNHIFVAISKACTISQNLDVGRQVHSDILKSPNEPDIFLNNCLVDMYARCGSLEDARRVFDNLQSKDVVTWTAMITGYALHGFDQEVLILFASMQQEGITPGKSSAAFASLLQACGSTRALHHGKQLHEQIRETGLLDDVLVGNCLIDMYSKCGSLGDARNVFDSLATRDVVTWNAMIAAYNQNGLGHEALGLYERMQQEGTTFANQVTYVCLLHACALAKALHQGKLLHAQIKETGVTSTGVIGNCLVDMYAKCGSLEDARGVFNKLPTRDVVTWNSMISGCAQHGLGQEALTLYESMRKEGVTRANDVTYVCLLQSCASLGDAHQGKQLHALIQESGLEHDLVVGTCLVDMYAKCGSLEDACRVFENLPRKNVVTWTALIAGYAQHGLGQEALTLYARMQLESATPANHVTFVSLLQACGSLQHLPQGKQIHVQIQERGLEHDNVVGNCLVDMYSKCGSLEDSRKVFDGMPTKNVVGWTAMISAYSQHGLGEEALALYAAMQTEGITPTDPMTFVCLLQACASVIQLEKGKEIHSQVCKIGLDTSDIFVANALIDMYGHARQGESTTVFDLFRRMKLEGMQPDHLTFLSVLTACNYSGLVDKGLNYFKVMSIEHGIPPTMEHYNCMVDLLGRAGQVQRAIEIVSNMPFEPNGEVWRSVLGACRKWNHVELGRQAFECALRLDKNDSAAYVLMSSIYMSAQLGGEAEKIQAMRVKERAWKKPGQSWWADMGGVVHTFVVGDREHPERAFIYERLVDLVVQIHEERCNIPLP